MLIFKILLFQLGRFRNTVENVIDIGVPLKIRLWHLASRIKTQVVAIFLENKEYSQRKAVKSRANLEIPDCSLCSPKMMRTK